MLPREIKTGPKQTLGIAWALVWRAVVIALPVSLLGQLFPWLNAPLIQVVTMPLIFWAATHWLLAGGRVGSQKILLMEQAHYQELVESISLKPSETVVEPKAQKS